MANPEHLDQLKQGVAHWNQWRQEHPDITPDLSRADLRRANLRRANLRRANLRQVDLSQADLGGAFLIGADLSRADISETILVQAFLREADLSGVDLSGANLSAADLRGANLHQADLVTTNFNWTILQGADFQKAIISSTIFADNDLRGVNGLDTVVHHGPSTIGIDTIYRSGGNIPEVFLRGAGLPDVFIDYVASLTGKSIQYYSCFISYSHKDQTFVNRLYDDLQNNGVRCWLATEDLKIGDKTRPTIDKSIRLHDKLLLVLSEHSVVSDWVEQEVETALAREREARKNGEETLVLFPVRLDNRVVSIDVGWPALIRNARHIGDFRKWKDHDSYLKAFNRLLRDLKTEGSIGTVDKS